ncbi:MAG: helix-turn-helix transcriptional regulator, partial [Chitinivibrionia bacterium]|nr:helix-turn-helix transcriptional regulator [Chitinivibrionia bacterium]
PWRYSWLVIEGPQAIPAMARAGLTPERPFRSGAIDDLVEPLCLELEKAYRFERFSELLPCAMAWRFVETLCPTDGLETSPRPETNLAENAKFLFDHEFNQYVEVEEVARLLGVTRSTLFRHFQACFGVSPKHYLMTVRVEQARRLLRQTSSPVKEVAAVCGFRSAHYFCRVFRDEMGMSPVAWRKRVA